MNPDGTNPSTNTGAGATSDSGAGAVVPPALDFTSSDTTNLSMADSLASAADNLTSAGMAAKTPDNGSIGLGQIGASDPSATMERPDEPLVPAAPVPGSLGSVTSGPAVASSDNAAGFGASTDATMGGYGASGTNAGGLGTSGSAATNSFGGNASTFGGTTSAGTGVGTTSSAGGYGVTSGFGATAGASTAPTTAGFGATPTTNNMSGVAAAGAPAGTAGSAVSGAAGGVPAGTNEPYNPFAKMGAGSAAGVQGGLGANKTAQTSSMNVPMGSQPATEKFSAKLSNAKKPSLLTVILAILAAVSLVMAIVFAVLWQQAEANKKVTYVPPITDDNNVNQTVAMVTCAKDLGMDGADVLAGLTNHSLVAKVNFANDQLSSVAMLNRYTFIDNAAAEASRGYFDGVTDWYNVLAGNLGVAAIATSFEVVDVTANYNVEAVPEQLVGDYIGVFGLAAGEDGSVDGSRGNIQAIYEANGYVCLED